MVTIVRGTRDTASTPTVVGTTNPSTNPYTPPSSTTPTTSTGPIIQPNPRPTNDVSVDDNGNLVITPAVDPPTDIGLVDQPIVLPDAVLALELNLGSSVAGGITPPGQRCYGGPNNRIRMLGGSRLNSDNNSIWFRFKGTYDTSGRIDWVLLPPKGVESSIVMVESTGQEIYFPITAAGLYKLVATIRDNNGKTLSSYTQFAVGTDPTNFPEFDTKWTGSTEVTVEPDPTTNPDTGTGGGGGTGTTPDTGTTPVVVQPTTPVALGTARNYSSVAQAVKLAASCNAVATQITVDSVSGLPTAAPYTLLLDYGTAQEEIVTVTAFSGTALTIKRGEDGTGATAHPAGADVRHGLTARDLREPQLHINAGAGVHGVAGNVVGTTDAQTLTGKTIDGQLNILKNIPASALSGTIASTDSSQEFTNKTIDGSKNTLKNIPTTALTGTSGFLTPTSTATLSNKQISGALNTFSQIPWSAIVGAPTSTGGSSYPQPMHWYLNGYAWNIWTNRVFDNNPRNLFSAALGNVPQGIVTITSSATFDVNLDCRVDFYIQAGASIDAATRRTVYWDGSGFGQARSNTSGASATFYWPGGNLFIRGQARRVAGAGGWTNQSADSFCEVAWMSTSNGDNALTNLG